MPAQEGAWRTDDRRARPPPTPRDLAPTAHRHAQRRGRAARTAAEAYQTFGPPHCHCHAGNVPLNAEPASLTSPRLCQVWGIDPTAHGMNALSCIIGCSRCNSIFARRVPRHQLPILTQDLPRPRQTNSADSTEGRAPNEVVQGRRILGRPRAAGAGHCRVGARVVGRGSLSCERSSSARTQGQRGVESCA